MQSLGIKAPQALNMVKVAAEGASVGHANLVDVTNALTASVASGIPGVKNYSQAMGVLNATVGAGDMTMQDLADAMGTGAVAAVKGYGLNIKDVGAALAVFGDNNIRGAKAGTDLRMSVQALAVPVSTASAELKKLGLTQTTLAGDMQSGGLLKALDDLQSKFKANGITAKNEGEVITDLFGKKAGCRLVDPDGADGPAPVEVPGPDEGRCRLRAGVGDHPADRAAETEAARVRRAGDGDHAGEHRDAAGGHRDPGRPGHRRCRSSSPTRSRQRG